MEPIETEKKILDFIKRNSKIFIYIIISFLILFLSFFWFLNKSNDKKVQISDDYIKAKILLGNGKNKKAEEILSNLIMNEDSIYSSLSLFLIIEKEIIKDKELILNYFDHILSGDSLKEEDLNLLKLKKAIFISDINKEQEIIELLNPLINQNSVWKAQALKFLGDFYYSFEQFQKAKQYYSLLSEINQISETDMKRKLETIKNE